MFKLKNLPLTISLIVVISLVAGWGISLVFAWTEPTNEPPGGDVVTPMNLGSTGQSKTGKAGFSTDSLDGGYGLTVGNSTNLLGIKTSGNSYFEKDILIKGGKLSIKSPANAERGKLFGDDGPPNSKKSLVIDVPSGDNVDIQIWGNSILFIKGISPSGIVGIATTDPDSNHKLDVNGSMRSKGAYFEGDVELSGTFKGIKPAGSYCSDAQVLKYDSPDDEWICADDIPLLGTITTGYSPKWDGSALVTGAVYQDNGNVGIGTASPDVNHKLTVAGGSMRSQGAYFEGNVDIGVSGGTIYTLQVNDENVCLADGTNCPTVDPDIITGAGTAGYLAAFSGTKTITNSIIYDNGSIGIGTTDPKAKLHVKTTVTPQCAGTADECYSFETLEGCGGDINDPQYGCSWRLLSCFQFDNFSECKTHLGCEWEPDAQFCFGNYQGCGGSPTACSSLTESQCPNQKGCSMGSSSTVAVFEGGRVGIGVTAPAYRLELPNISSVDGRARADAWTTYSSRRWKENIVPIENALDKISQLQGVYFDWKPEYGGTHGIGLIAEDVGKIIPELVDWEDDGIYAKSLDYDHLVALLVEAVKEQQKEIEELRQEIGKLKKEMEELKAIINRK